MYVCLLNGDDSVKHSVKDERKVWLHVAKGFVSLNNLELCAGDGAAIIAEDIHLFNGQNAEVIIFDMAPYVEA